MTEILAEDKVLDVKNLQTVFFTNSGLFKAVDDLSFTVRRGETLAIVGESGCGKSVTALSIMRLVPDPPGRIIGGSVALEGPDVLSLDEEHRVPACMRRTDGACADANASEVEHVFAIERDVCLAECGALQQLGSQW